MHSNQESREYRLQQLAKFRQQYPTLYNFLGGYFPDADLEGFTSDEAVARNFAQTESEPAIKKVIEQGTKFLSRRDVYWEIIGKGAYRLFKDEDEAYQWLEKMIEILKSTQSTERQ